MRSYIKSNNQKVGRRHNVEMYAAEIQQKKVVVQYKRGTMVL